MILWILLIGYVTLTTCKLKPEAGLTSVEDSANLKAICSILVVLFHCSILIGCPAAIAPVKLIGKHMVGIFFFFTGYGTALKFKGPQTFRRKTVAKFKYLGVAYLLSNLVYWAAFHTNPEYVHADSNVLFPPANSTLWYIVSLLLFDGLFYLNAILAGGGAALRKISLLTGAEIVILTIIGAFCNVPSYYVVSNAALILGMAIAAWKERYAELLKHRKRWMLLTADSAIASAVLEVGAYILFEDGAVKNLILCFSVLFFTLFAVTLQAGFTYKPSRFLDIIGKSSAEIYIYHFTIVVLCSDLHKRNWISHAEAASFLAVTASIALGILLHETASKIKKKLKEKTV